MYISKSYISILKNKNENMLDILSNCIKSIIVTKSAFLEYSAN